MCKKDPLPEMMHYMDLTRDTALWMAAEERLEKCADRKNRKKNQERWEMK